MLLKKQVKAGVLIYALLMAAIFILLLEFYLDRLVANQRQSQALDNASQAYLVAQMVNQEAQNDTGELSFDKGRASYQKEGELLKVSVTLSNGEHYQYDFVSGSSAPSTTESSKDKASSSTSSDEISSSKQSSSSAQGSSSHDSSSTESESDSSLAEEE